VCGETILTLPAASLKMNTLSALDKMILIYTKKYNSIVSNTMN